MFTRRFATSMVGTTLTAATGPGHSASPGPPAQARPTAFLARLHRRTGSSRRAQRAPSRRAPSCDAPSTVARPKSGHQGGGQATGLSAKGAKTFTVDAASAYCPQYVTSS